MLKNELRSLARSRTNKKENNIELWQVQQWRHTRNVELNECDLIWNTNKIFNSWCCLPAASHVFPPLFLSLSLRLCLACVLCVHIKKPTILCLAENIESLLPFAFFLRKSDYKYKQSHCAHTHTDIEIDAAREDGTKMSSIRIMRLWSPLNNVCFSLTLPLSRSLNVTNTTHANNANERKCVNEPQNKKSREWVRGGKQ